jgi:HlyD family secretion protein
MPSRSRILLLVVVAVAAVAGVLAWYQLRGEAAPEDVLVLYGNVEVRDVDLAFNVEGRLEEMLVEEGDRVEQGQTLARLDPSYLESALAVAEARADAQRAVVAKLEAGSRPAEIARAEAELAEARAAAENARLILQRRQTLVVSDTVSQQALDDARAALQQAEAEVEAQRETLTLLREGPRQEDIEAARAQLRADMATIELIQRRLEETDLKAPSDGTVLTRVREPGAVVLPTSSIYTLALTDPVWVRTYVPETELGRVVPGMTAEVTADSLPGEVYSGQVGFISPTAEFTPKSVQTPELRTDLVYRARVIVGAPDQGLRQGMPVTITLRPGRPG